MYAIKLPNKNKYIKYCDDCWYETEPFPFFRFSYEKAKAIAQQLQTHYINSVELVSENGDIEIIDNRKSFIKSQFISNTLKKNLRIFKSKKNY